MQPSPGQVEAHTTSPIFAVTARLLTGGSQTLPENSASWLGATVGVGEGDGVGMRVASGDRAWAAPPRASAARRGAKTIDILMGILIVLLLVNRS
jgi:hypothetical protein